MASPCSMSGGFVVIHPLWDTVAASGLDIVPRAEAPGLWADVLARAAHAPANYSPSMLDYQAAYHGLADLSCLIRADGGPAAVWPLGISEATVTSNGGPILPPLFANDVTERVRKKVVRGCLDALAGLSGSLGACSWSGSEIVGPGGCSLWHRMVMERGAQVSCSHELFADLGFQVDALHLSLRKSYRSLISSAAQRWTVELLSGEAELLPDRWDEFRRLHETVSGRVTRGRETWDIQERAVRDGEGLLVTLSGPRTEGRMAGGAFFHISRTESLYAVGVYDRELEAAREPLGHLIQWRAMEWLKGHGIRWHRLGARPYVGDEKVQSIGYFKEGFATHWFPQITTECPV